MHYAVPGPMLQICNLQIHHRIGCSLSFCQDLLYYFVKKVHISYHNRNQISGYYNLSVAMANNPTHPPHIDLSTLPSLN